MEQQTSNTESSDVNNSTEGTGSTGVASAPATSADASQGTAAFKDPSVSQPQATQPQVDSTLKRQETQQVQPEEQNSEQPQYSNEEVLQAFVMQYINNNGLTDEEIIALRNLGYSDEYFGMIADAQRTIIEKNEAAIFEAVGGKEQYQELQKFGNTLSQEVKDAFNEAMFSGSNEIRQIAVLGLQALYNQSKGPQSQGPKKTISGNANSDSAAGGYSTQAELIQDLNNPKYGIDPEFTKLVQAKRNRSPW